jgi:hypothetical protein
MTPAEQYAKSWIYSQRALRVILADDISIGLFDHKGAFITMIDLSDFDAGMRELWGHLWRASGLSPYEKKEIPKIDLSQLLGDQ